MSRWIKSRHWTMRHLNKITKILLTSYLWSIYWYICKVLNNIAWLVVLDEINAFLKTSLFCEIFKWTFDRWWRESSTLLGWSASYGWRLALFWAKRFLDYSWVSTTLNNAFIVLYKIHFYQRIIKIYSVRFLNFASLG